MTIEDNDWFKNLVRYADLTLVRQGFDPDNYYYYYPEDWDDLDAVG